MSTKKTLLALSSAAILSATVQAGFYNPSGGQTIYNPNPPSTMFEEESLPNAITSKQAQEMNCFTLKSYPPKYICDGKQYAHKEESKIATKPLQVQSFEEDSIPQKPWELTFEQAQEMNCLVIKTFPPKYICDGKKYLHKVDRPQQTQQQQSFEENPIVVGVVRAIATDVAIDYAYNGLKAGTEWAVNKIRTWDEDEEEELQGVWGQIGKEVATGVISSFVVDGIHNGVAWVGQKTGWYEETVDGQEELDQFSKTFTRTFITEFSKQSQTPIDKLDKDLLKIVHNQGKTLVRHLHPKQDGKTIIAADIAHKYAKTLATTFEEEEQNIVQRKQQQKSKSKFVPKKKEEFDMDIFDKRHKPLTGDLFEEDEFSIMGALNSIRSWQTSTLGATKVFDEDNNEKQQYRRRPTPSRKFRSKF